MDCGWFDVSGFPPAASIGGKCYSVACDTSAHEHPEQGDGLYTICLLERLDLLTEDLLALKQRLETTEPLLDLPTIREEVRKQILLVLQEYENVNQQWEKHLGAVQISLADLSSPAALQPACNAAEACPGTRGSSQRLLSSDQPTADDDLQSGRTDVTASGSVEAEPGTEAAYAATAETAAEAGDRQAALAIHRHVILQRCRETDKRINKLAEGVLHALQQMEERIEVVQTKAADNASQLKNLADKVFLLEGRQREAGSNLGRQREEHERRLFEMSGRLESLQQALTSAQDEITAVKASVGALRQHDATCQGVHSPCFEDHIRSTLVTLQYQVDVLGANQIQMQQSVRRLLTEGGTCNSRRVSFSESDSPPDDSSNSSSGDPTGTTTSKKRSRSNGGSNGSNRSCSRRNSGNSSRCNSGSSSKSNSRSSSRSGNRKGTAEATGRTEIEEHNKEWVGCAAAAATSPADAPDATVPTGLGTADAEGTSEGATESPFAVAESSPWSPAVAAPAAVKEAVNVPLATTLTDFGIVSGNLEAGETTREPYADLIAVDTTAAEVPPAEHAAAAAAAKTSTTRNVGARLRESSLRRVKLNSNSTVPSPSATLADGTFSAVSFFSADEDENLLCTKRVAPLHDEDHQVHHQPELQQALRGEDDQRQQLQVDDDNTPQLELPQEV